MKILKSIYLTCTAVIITACSTTRNITHKNHNYTVTIPAKKIELTENQLNNWMHADLVTDTIPGMSTAKAYTFLANKKATTVIVGVLDSGTNLKHEDLVAVAWVNEGEIAENGIDDDQNGYIDDINGWNFLGDIYKEHLEYQRIIIDSTITDAATYASAKKLLDDKITDATTTKQRYEVILQSIKDADSAFIEYFAKKEYTSEEILKIETEDTNLLQNIGTAKKMFGYGLSSLGVAEKYLSKEIKKLNKVLKKNFLTKEYRAILNDNPNDITDTHYGNNNTEHTSLKESHGTHVSGIIAASINNNLGMNGVATHVKIMALRAVPSGDEYDKDIALGIRYAVDNGAKIINTSFGKGFSPQKEWVWDAIKYAAKHDVLIVNAAGNSGQNIDIKKTFPNDSKDLKTEISDNFITIGAISFNYDEHLPAIFSNYGKINVDLFAPGVAIYSTTPENNYEKNSGTSMASPAVAGVAALIRSYYPNLTASQVKFILMKSGTFINFNVIKPGTKDTKIAFSELCVSGKIINAYQAILLADKMSK